MPKYLVMLCRNTYDYADVVVEASSEAHAETLAEEMGRVGNVEWEPGNDPDHATTRAINVEEWDGE